MKKIAKFFFPHESNNYRARLLHLDSLIIIILFLVIGAFSLSGIKSNFPSVLGISTGMTTDQLLTLTNQKRIENGLPPLSMNGELSAAAENKASDMFTMNYWAHNSPSGTTPWDFIAGAGYSYSYAGENLARGFDNPSDVVNAWMASPEHRQNILSANYKNIGFAIRTGSLTGEDTVLVVQMFGTGKALAESKPSEVASVVTTQEEVKPEVESTQEIIPTSTPIPTLKPQNEGQNQKPQLVAENLSEQQTIQGAQSRPLFNSRILSKNIVLIIIYILILVLIIDIIVIEKKKIIRFVGHNLDHLLFLIFVLSVIFLFTKGFIV